jgi:hypothetical protein
MLQRQAEAPQCQQQASDDTSVTAARRGCESDNDTNAALTNRQAQQCDSSTTMTTGG